VLLWDSGVYQSQGLPHPFGPRGCQAFAGGVGQSCTTSF
jgi:hypothetical protein